jgi:hypothetical protein
MSIVFTVAMASVAVGHLGTRRVYSIYSVRSIYSAHNTLSGDSVHSARRALYSQCL